MEIARRTALALGLTGASALLLSTARNASAEEVKEVAPGVLAAGSEIRPQHHEKPNDLRNYRRASGAAYRRPGTDDLAAR